MLFTNSAQVTNYLSGNIADRYDCETLQVIFGSYSVFDTIQILFYFTLQTNAKLEAELLYLRDEVAEAQLSALKAESERRYLIFALQSALLENHKVNYIYLKGVP